MVAIQVNQQVAYTSATTPETKPQTKSEQSPPQSNSLAQGDEFKTSSKPSILKRMGKAGLYGGLVGAAGGGLSIFTSMIIGGVEKGATSTSLGLGREIGLMAGTVGMAGVVGFAVGGAVSAVGGAYIGSQVENPKEAAWVGGAVGAGAVGAVLLKTGVPAGPAGIAVGILATGLGAAAGAISSYQVSKMVHVNQ